MDRDTLLAASAERHSVRAYDGRALNDEDRAYLEGHIREINATAGLHIQLVCGEKDAFTGLLAKYGNFRGVANYLVLAGPDTPQLDELCGYWGELLVLQAQARDLRTCWVGGTFARKKTKYELAPGERMSLIVALGNGTTDGRPHPARKTAADVSTAASGVQVPAWFTAGVEEALMAPTAIHQQKFRFTYLPVIGAGAEGAEGKVKATTGNGPFCQVDLGIAKLHFELGSGKGSDIWA